MNMRVLWMQASGCFSLTSSLRVISDNIVRTFQPKQCLHQPVHKACGARILRPSPVRNGMPLARIGFLPFSGGLTSADEAVTGCWSNWQPGNPTAVLGSSGVKPFYTSCILLYTLVDIASQLSNPDATYLLRAQTGADDVRKCRRGSEEREQEDPGTKADAGKGHSGSR